MRANKKVSECALFVIYIALGPRRKSPWSCPGCSPRRRRTPTQRVCTCGWWRTRTDAPRMHEHLWKSCTSFVIVRPPNAFSAVQSHIFQSTRSTVCGQTAYFFKLWKFLASSNKEDLILQTNFSNIVCGFKFPLKTSRIYSRGSGKLIFILDKPTQVTKIAARARECCWGLQRAVGVH